MEKYAQSMLDALKNYEDVDKNSKLFEATLAIIGSKLLNSTEKATMHHLFKIMDESFDGKIGEEELVRGYYKVLGDELTIE